MPSHCDTDGPESIVELVVVLMCRPSAVEGEPDRAMAALAEDLVGAIFRQRDDVGE